jgi:4-amino-4-deoxy-L-arabinose transferase-like glycosyltransferase
MALAAVWAMSTTADRLWLGQDRRLPSWDQADYLNSAVDHGRALGLLPGGGWLGLDHLLDLSPKIPPLASLVNGTVMAIAGDSPDQASWALALWFGLLVVAMACWARDLGGRGFALLAVVLLALQPALAQLRVDYTLDIPLTACSTLALWLLGRWQAPVRQGGGRWGQAVGAALAIAAALLVKQSALLVLAGPCLWAAGLGLRRPHRRLQLLAALAIVLGLILPWLHHNWITTLGGTNRAVIESAAKEGDPAVFSLASLVWYPRLWPEQLGLVLLLPAAGVAIGAAVLALGQRRLLAPGRRRLRLPSIPPGWGWLIGCSLAGWLGTSLSPNKDPRYIAPVLPLLTLLVARLWWQLGLWWQSRRQGHGSALVAAGLLALGLVAGGADLGTRQARALQRLPPSPAPEAMADLRRRVGQESVTLLVVPGSPDLNEQTLTPFGRGGGGRIAARRLGRNRREHPVVLQRSEWILLATGDQGTNRPGSRELSHRIRADGRFRRVAHWPWDQGREVELWQRRAEPPFRSQPFDMDFINLARGMETGPRGVKALFDRLGAEHQADGHFLYQQRVRAWATRRLAENPQDRDALWSLALIDTLRNRPSSAQRWYGRLQELDPLAPWPVAYRAVVLLADWQPAAAAKLLVGAPETVASQPVVRALGNLSRGLSGHPMALESLRVNLPAALALVRENLDQAPPPSAP